MYQDNHFFSILRVLVLTLAGLAVGSVGFVGSSRAATDVEIFDISIATDYSGNEAEIDVQWYSDVQTTGVLEYGTESGVYTERRTTPAGLYHFVYIRPLPRGVRYYLRITATAPDGGSASSEINIITKSSPVIPALVFTDAHLAVAGPNQLFVEYATTRSQAIEAAYGTSPDALSNTAPCNSNNLYCVIGSLQPATTYYVQLSGWNTSSGTSNKVSSDVLTATTSGAPTIASITPSTGKKNAKVTVAGTNLRSPGNTKKPTYLRIAVGCKLADRSSKPCSETVKVLSWTDTKIVYRAGKRAKTGKVYIGRYYRGNIVYTVKGPVFTVRQ